MMKRASFFALVAVAAGTLLSAASGCELIASVDRSKIAEGGGGAGGAIGGGGTPTTGGTGGTGGVAPTCTDPAVDCTDPLSGECKVWTCDAGACAEADAMDGTDAATQTAGDCKKNVCMGGAVMSENDDMDPLDDMNDCTVDSCNAGMPESTPSATGVMCASSGGKVCDGMGACVECNDNTDCTDPANPICSMGNLCIPATCTDGMLNGNETDTDCGGDTCDPCDTGQVCNIATDCYHGVCNAGGTCAMPTCSDGVQNGGEYLMDNGETDTDCGGPCGATCGPNEGCNDNGDCVGNQCTGMAGTCVPNCSDQVLNNMETDVDCGGGTCGACMIGQMCGMSDANCVAAAYCDMMVCTAKKAPGDACGGDNQCAAGVCDPTDMVCCNQACGGTCQSCKLAGSAGTCTTIPSGADPEDECAGTLVCDGGGMGNGQCKQPNGGTCAAGGDCLSGNCVDGVCCNTACPGTCKACDVAGSVGTCTNVPNNQDLDNECAGALNCNGSGACYLANGAACTLAGQCGSGNCVDGVCCDTACDGACQACSVTGSEGTCTPYAAGDDPEGECTSPPNCNGASACGLGASGAPCVPGAVGACVGPVDCPAGGMCP